MHEAIGPLILYIGLAKQTMLRGRGGQNGNGGVRKEKRAIAEGGEKGRTVSIVVSKPRDGGGQGSNSLLRLGKPYPRPIGRMLPFILLKHPTPLTLHLISVPKRILTFEVFLLSIFSYLQALFLMPDELIQLVI